MTLKTLLRISAASLLLGVWAAFPPRPRTRPPAAPAPKAPPPPPRPSAKTYVDSLKVPQAPSHHHARGSPGDPSQRHEAHPHGGPRAAHRVHARARPRRQGGRARVKPALAAMFGEVERSGSVTSMNGDQVDDFLERIGTPSRPTSGRLRHRHRQDPHRPARQGPSALCGIHS